MAHLLERADAVGRAPTTAVGVGAEEARRAADVPEILVVLCIPEGSPAFLFVRVARETESAAQQRCCDAGAADREPAVVTVAVVLSDTK